MSDSPSLPRPTPPEPPDRPRILSGMRPTGRLHLGNYMGALYNWVNLQNERQGPTDPEPGAPKYDCFFFIADWHALTTDYADPSRLKQNVFEIALDFLAAGLDPQKSTIFIQSHVPQHAELNLLLSMITPVSWLERVPTYKDQQEQLREKDLATYGFLGYPLLQSADILLYRPRFVPVGADQVAHIEITREIARRFNFLYPRDPEVQAAPMLSYSRQSVTALGKETEFRTAHPQAGPGDGQNYRQGISLERLILPSSATFPEPEALLTPSPKLPGTDGRKMSKSYGNTISLTDPDTVVRTKMLQMTNGGQRPFLELPGDPEICPVGDLHRVFSTPDMDAAIRQGCRTAAISCEDCKLRCSTSIEAHLQPIRDQRAKLEANPDQVWEALDRGSERAQNVANEAMTAVRALTGLSRDRSGVRVEPSSKYEQSIDTRDLPQTSEWWTLEPLPLNRQLGEYWYECVRPIDVILAPETESVWLTPNHRRVLVAGTKQANPATWTFAVKPKSYELLVLLCWGTDSRLHDFVLPQKLYVTAWTAAKKAAGKSDLVFSVAQDGTAFDLNLPGAAPIRITAFEAAYQPLSA